MSLYILCMSTDIVTRHSVSLIHGMFSSSSRTAYIFETVTGTYYWRIRGFGEVIIPYGVRKMYCEPLAL
jgi:hypothetical protein